MSSSFDIVNEVMRHYRRSDIIGTQHTLRFITQPKADTNTVINFLARVNDLFEHAVQDVTDGDMVGMSIHGEVNQNDKSIGIIFRRRYKLSGEVIWNIFEKVALSNDRFNVLETLTVVEHAVTILWISVVIRL